MSQALADFPCQGCADRSVGCHGRCEAYKAAQAEYLKRKDALCREYYAELDATDYAVGIKERIAKKLAQMKGR